MKVIEVMRGSHKVAQKKALEGMDLWKRLNDERLQEADEEMDVDS